MPDRPPQLNPVASTHKRRRLQRWATFGYAVLLLIISVMPSRGLPRIFSWSDVFSPDKVGHFGAYAIFAVLLSFTVHMVPVWKRVATAILIASVFGMLMEVLQAVAGTGREFDLSDMLANLLGATLGGLVYLPLRKLVSKYVAPAAS